MSGEISRWSLFDRGLFFRRKFTFKLSHDLPCQLAFDCEYIRDVAIVPFRPKLAVGPRIDQLSVDAHTAAGPLHAAFQYMRDAERLGDLAQI